MLCPPHFSLSCFHTHLSYSLFFFFNDPATTEIYTLSLHDALPISCTPAWARYRLFKFTITAVRPSSERDRKSTRLNSSHRTISYAVFCLKKKKKKKTKTVKKHKNEINTIDIRSVEIKRVPPS